MIRKKKDALIIALVKFLRKVIYENQVYSERMLMRLLLGIFMEEVKGRNILRERKERYKYVMRWAVENTAQTFAALVRRYSFLILCCIHVTRTHVHAMLKNWHLK